MTKTELIAKVAENTEMTKKDAEAVINETLAQITEALRSNDKIALIGFGTFEVRKRAARTGKNPRTGEIIKIAESKIPAFKAGKALKDTVNK